MKHIPLRVLPDPDQPDDPTTTLRYADVVEQVIRRPLDPQAGVNMDEMRKGIRVLDALDAAIPKDANGFMGEGTLDLEDADYAHLAEKTKVFPWGMVDRRLMQFVDDVLDAEKES